MKPQLVNGASLPEVHATVLTARPTVLRRMLAFAGPAYLVSVGYMDPGNWATDLEGGARFGYQLVWVLVLSNLMAILLQTLAARLGIVAGRDLAQACREAFPRPVTLALWGLCEIAIAACDLAEVLGAAIALNLLFGLPLLIGVLLTGLDTLFAVAWADLDKEPLVLSVPDTDGRYYVIALFDLWSNVFASIGKRTTGTGAGSFLIAGPGWHGTPPSDVKQVFRSPTRFVWVNGQMQANGPADYVAVNALQKQYKLTPLSAWGRPYTAPAEVPVAAGVDAKTPPLERV